jgi:DNA polymerase-3 subunit delta'
MIPIGHDAAISILLTAARGERMHHAWLFCGPQGVGKALVARMVATRLLAESSNRPPIDAGVALASSHPTVQLIASGAHADFIWLERLERDKGTRARNISTDQIRALGPKFALAPSHGQRRIVVIDAVDDLEKSAANALLKSLEEPPAHTIFFLISHAPGRLLPTIRSRCRSLRFAPLNDTDMRAVLCAQLPDTAPDELERLIAMSEGAPGRALALAGLDITSIDAALSEIARTGDPHNGVRAALAAQFAAKSAQPRYEAFLKRAPHFIATQARTRHGLALAQALEAYTRATELAATAPIHNIDPQSAVFEMGSIIANLGSVSV